MKKLWKFSMAMLLVAGMLMTGSSALEVQRDTLEIEQREDGVYFWAHTSRPDYWKLDLRYRLTQLPEGFRQKSTHQGEYEQSIFYVDQKEDRAIDFRQLAESSSFLWLSQPGDALEEVRVRGYKGALITFGGTRGKSLGLIWHDSVAASYFELQTMGMTREEILEIAEGVTAESQFKPLELVDGGCNCDCGGSFRVYKGPKLQKTIDRDSPGQRGTKWVYTIEYRCDGNCRRTRIFGSYPAIPVD